MRLRSVPIAIPVLLAALGAGPARAHLAPEAPRQVELREPEFRFDRFRIAPVARFAATARVLARRDYSSDVESALAPTDLALGWGRMREDAVLSQLDIDQSNRWYHYRWMGAPPIPVNEIVRSSANMQMIPSSDLVAKELARVREGDQVRIDGWLVQADAPDGWRWRSSLTRDDSGGGACEVVYVCSISRSGN